MQATFTADGTLLLRIAPGEPSYARMATAAGRHLLEAEQKRGQPDNAGQFGPGGGGKKTTDKKGASGAAKPSSPHPLADAKDAAEVLKIVNPAGGPLGAMADANPLKYDTASFPSGVDGAKLTQTVVSAVQKQRETNAFKRLDLMQVYDVAKQGQPDLSYYDFQSSLAKLQQDKKVTLGPYTQGLATHEKPQLLMPLNREMKWYVDLP